MPELNDPDRSKVWRRHMASNMKATGQSFGDLTKQDIRAAVNALDTFFNDNLPLFNAAIPEPARTELTARQKALMLTMIIEQRFLSDV